MPSKQPKPKGNKDMKFFKKAKPKKVVRKRK